jgi:hypothetical protein
MVAADAGLPRIPCPSVPKEVVLLEPVVVTAPERVGTVVTVAALPEMEPVMRFENVLFPLHVLEFAKRVVEAMVMSAEPLKDTPFMSRAFWSVVAVLALPPILREEVAAYASAVPAEFE